MWRHMALVRTEIWEERIVSITRMIHSSETSVLTGTTRRHIPEDGSLHSHRRENLKSYMEYYLLIKP
jgi:hypothetical protein